VWLESYKFLSTYKLDDQTMIEFRERYRHFTFELLIYPLEDWCRRFRIGDAIKPEENKKPLFHTIRFGVSEVASVNEVVEGIVSTCSLDYPSYMYGLYHHNGQQLPLEETLWRYMDKDISAGDKDCLVLKMMPRVITTCMANEVEQTTESLVCDLSQPGGMIREMLCRRYGVRYPELASLVSRGRVLDLSRPLLQQSVFDYSQVVLVCEKRASIQTLHRHKQRLSKLSFEYDDKEAVDVRSLLTTKPGNSLKRSPPVWKKGIFSEL
jgi:hypothetical protein